MTTQRHAELGASKTYRWTHCPGSVRLCRDLPDVDTPYAAEGRKAHTLAELSLLGVLGEVDPASYDEEMLAHVQVYVDFVRGLVAAQPGSELRVEVKFDLARLNPPQEMFGTADAVVYAGLRIDVVDLKYGSGVVVEVEENEQLLYYVTGALVNAVRAMTSIPPEYVIEQALASFDEIWVHIVQPRAPHAAGPVRSWQVPKERVREFVRHLIFKASATLDPSAPLHAGPWCKFCPAQSRCPEVSRYALQVARTDFAVVPPPAESLPVDVAADILTKAEILRHWLVALENRVKAELESGRPVPGWKLVTKRPTRVWNNVDALMEWYDGDPQDLYEEPALMSPAQVEKLVGKLNLPTELYSYVSSGLTLAPESDRRPAVATGPKEDFAALPPGAVDSQTEETTE